LGRCPRAAPRSFIEVREKNPKRVAAGKLNMLARWGEPRYVRLDELTNEQRRLVRALVDAMNSKPTE
jgi:hypothetical protein